MYYMGFDVFCCFHSFQLIGSFLVHFCFLFVPWSRLLFVVLQQILRAKEEGICHE